MLWVTELNQCKNWKGATTGGLRRCGQVGSSNLGSRRVCSAFGHDGDDDSAAQGRHNNVRQALRGTHGETGSFTK